MSDSSSSRRGWGSWPRNYRFGYLCAWAAVIVGVVLAARGLVAGEYMDAVMGAIALLGGGVLAWQMPRWALDAAAEEERRAAARQGREELRRAAARQRNRSAK